MKTIKISASEHQENLQTTDAAWRELTYDAAMSVENIRKYEASRICTRDAHCPVCARQNLCRMETGECYRGPYEPRCFCQSCLEAIAAKPEITWHELVARDHATAPSLAIFDGDTYQEGATIVFTAQFHLRRGYCCGNGCRHCPY